MKKLNNNLIKVYSLLSGSRRLLCFILVTATLFFTGCEKDWPNSNKDIKYSETSNLSTTDPYEAEMAVLSGVVVSANQPGYTGSGFADYVNASGDYIEWTINSTITGSFALEFRYANGGTTNRPLKVQVNGATVAANLSFSPTNGWAKWSISAVNANLVVGPNKIRLTATGSNGPNIDYLALKAAVNQSGKLEAENALLSGAVVTNNQPGYTGTGFADYVHASGDFVEWAIPAAAAGSFSLQFRYANGGTTNRPLQLQVNGVTVAARLAFPSTGSFANWSLVSASANLIAGANTVRLTTTGSNGPNLDNLSYSSGTTKHVLYLVDNGFSKLLFLNQKDSSKNWTVAIPDGSRDLQLVANNKLLVSHGNGAAEYDRATGAKGWSISNYSGVSTAQRLANGNTLLGWSKAASGGMPAKVILSEVNSTGKEVKQVTINYITTFRLARRLPNGNTLITGDANGDKKYKVFEVNANGTIIWQQLLYGGKGYVANRLANGNTYATMGPVGDLYEPGKDDNKVLQLSSTGSVVKFWGGMANHPNARLKKFSGYSVVPGNGNLLVANWLGDGNVGTGPHAVEFDANNNLVWSWEDHSAAKTITNLLVVD
ncbi:carbohydrate-binding protein [Adhaeribacter pallidiroseus]|uniref:Arabinan endo-1,5-alpha-L-arabinosidase n=1 Tax=Adhaeribacter pallidiroseus TaxID=2072847 RepID=A0A369QME8_9BACT|nr:carbohydrate-binding protein [Adhaeribacter pallidiroseus]RDC64427.1 Arabinan endo-1,5-alpha-L-arabinosidase [Adhaeribacter pallidiroseus]